MNTASEKSLFVEFLAHTFTSTDGQPGWLEKSVGATHQTPVKSELQERENDKNRSPGPQENQRHATAGSAAQATLNSVQAGTEHPAVQEGTPQDTEAVPAHLTSWMCPPQASQSPQAQFQLPESSVIAPEAAAALESSSAAAADALHGILVQVAASRGEDTTSFVQKALKDPSIMQVLLLHATPLNHAVYSLVSFHVLLLFGSVRSPLTVSGSLIKSLITSCDSVLSLEA